MAGEGGGWSVNGRGGCVGRLHGDGGGGTIIMGVKWRVARRRQRNRLAAEAAQPETKMLAWRGQHRRQQLILQGSITASIGFWRAGAVVKMKCRKEA